jgi:hypothetical protein
MTDQEIRRAFAEVTEAINRLRITVLTLNKTLAPIIEEAEDWRTFQEAARFFSVKPNTIINWVKKGGLETRWSPKRNVKVVSLNALIKYRDEATGRLREDLNKKFAERNERVSKMLDAIREVDDEV